MIAAQSVLASLEARVAQQPWKTLAGAFLLGAWVGSHPPRLPRNRVTRAVFALVGSLALRVVREIAFREILERAARAAPMDDRVPADAMGATGAADMDPY